MRHAWRDLGRGRVVVFVVALLVYLPGFWWGLPHVTAPDRRQGWGVDDEPPLGPLAQLHDLVTPGPANNPNLGYPMLHPFMVIGSVAPYLVYLKTTGQLRTPSGVYPYGLRDPARHIRVMALIARLLSVLLGAGVVLAAFEIGRTLWGVMDGWWAAAFALLVYPMFYYARTSNVDVPVLFFSAWAMVVFARCLALGLSVRRGIVLGTLTGLAVATKEPAFASFVGVPLVLLFLPVDASEPRPRRAVLGRVALWGLAAAGVAYAVGSGLVVDPDRWIAHIAFARARAAELAAGEVAFAANYPFTLDGHAELARRLTSYAIDALSLPGVVLGVIGVGLAWHRERRTALFAVTIASYLLVLFFTARSTQLRYLLPVAFALAIFAGHAVARAATTRWANMPVRVVAAAALAVGALRGVDLTYAMLMDSRYDAAEWLSRVAQPGDRLEYFGSSQKNPPLPAHVHSSRAIVYLGGSVRPPIDEATSQTIRDAWRARRPRFIILTPDYTSRPGEPYAASCPPAIYEDLEQGRLGYVRARFFQTPTLLPWVRRPPLDYPVVNPPIRIYLAADDPALETR